MTSWSLRRTLMTMIGIVSWLVPHQSFAQEADVGISGVGLLSIQPTDDAYLGSPYLSEAIGGVGPGFGAGVNVIMPSGFVVAAEYSTAFFKQEQSGRVVVGEGILATTRLRDSLLTGLIGYSTGAGNTRVQFLGGVSARLDLPTIDGEPVDPDRSNKNPALPIVLSTGIDLLQTLNRRTALVIGARYSFNDRHEIHQYLGIGPHILRVAGGIRIRLN